MPSELFNTEIFAPLLLGPDGVVSRAGNGWRALFSVEPSELEGQALRELVDSDSRDAVDQTLANLEKGAPSAVIRARLRLAGRPFRLRLRLQPTPSGLLVVAEDITERRSTIARETRLRALTDHAHDAWFVHDLEGRIRDANPWACESLGYTYDELLGLHLAEIEQTIQPGRMDGVWNRMEVGKPVTVEGRHKRKDGTIFPVEVSLGLFETEDEEVLMLAVVRDVTERKAAERRTLELNEQLTRANDELQGLSERLAAEVAERTREVAETASQLEATISHLADGLCSIAPDRTIQRVNPAFESLLQLADLEGKPSKGQLPDALCEVIDKVRSSGRTHHGELELPGGRAGHATASAVSQEGEEPGVVVLVRDVTLEREVDRMKTDFIATVSHELRTPLTSVLGFAKLTSTRLEEKIFPHIPEEDRRAMRAVKQVRGNVEIILAEGKRLTALINDVLDISKMESGRMEWHMSSLQPGQLVRRAVDATSALFEGHPATLRVEVDDGLPRIRGDEDRLLQVLINLISNAAKFTAQGHITVRALRDGEQVRFEVQDTGSGIDPALHGQIFEKFRQVGDTLTAKPQGTGLGLPICRQIVQAHEGSIHVKSAMGRGSLFWFVLPLAEKEEAMPPRPGIRDLESLVQRIEATVPRTRLPEAGSDVLVVDDDPSLRELLKQQLGERGYGVRLAANGREAMAQVRAKRPDLVILDVMMPELSGFDVAAMLKADPETQSIPILILSIVQDRERGLRLGVDRYLTKPADPDALLDHVQDLLAQVRSPRRVLVVDESATATTDIVGLLEAKGYEVVGTCVGADCLEQARQTLPDLILVESMVGDSGELVRTIRFERGLEHIYVVQLMDESEVP